MLNLISGSRRLLLTPRDGRPAILVRGAKATTPLVVQIVSAVLVVAAAMPPYGSQTDTGPIVFRFLLFIIATTVLSLAGIGALVTDAMSRARMQKRPLLQRGLVLGGVGGGAGYRAAADDGALVVDGAARRVETASLEIALHMVLVPATQTSPAKLEEKYLLQLAFPDGGWTLESFDARGDAVWVGREIASALGIAPPSGELVLDDPEAAIQTTPVWAVAAGVSVELAACVALGTYSLATWCHERSGIHPLVAAGIVLALHVGIMAVGWCLGAGERAWVAPAESHGQPDRDRA